ncbi:MAG: hypothetical protein HYS14_04385 [Candidatus Rokubacteria bacterium]|nr:hypothetical protein [Candidatus Rokubacteria bacterium]
MSTWPNPHTARQRRPGFHWVFLGGMWGTLALGLLTASPPIAAQEILSVQVLDLTVLEVQIVVSGAHGEDQVQCLLRDSASGLTRVGSTEAVSKGLASGRLTLLSLVLPLLNPHETEFAVALVRANTVLRRTEWRPLLRGPQPATAPLDPRPAPPPSRPGG